MTFFRVFRGFSDAVFCTILIELCDFRGSFQEWGDGEIELEKQEARTTALQAALRAVERALYRVP